MTDKQTEISEIPDVNISQTPITEENREPLIPDSPLTPYTRPAVLPSSYKEDDAQYCKIAPHGISQQSISKEFMKNLMDTPREIPNSPTPLKSLFTGSGSSEEVSLNLSASNSPMLDRDLRNRLEELTHNLARMKSLTKDLNSKILAKERMIKQDSDTLDGLSKDLTGLKEQRDLFEVRIEQRKNELEKKSLDIKTLKGLHEKAVKEEVENRNKMSMIFEDKENIRKEVEKLRTDFAKEKLKASKLSDSLSRTEVEGSPGKRQSLHNEIQYLEDLIQDEKNLHFVKIQELGDKYKNRLNTESSNTSRNIQSEIEEINLLLQQQMLYNEEKSNRLSKTNILEAEEEIIRSERSVANELLQLEAEKLALMEKSRQLERNIRRLKENPGNNWSTWIGILFGVMVYVVYHKIIKI